MLPAARSTVPVGPLIPCECYIPYRETVDYINGEMERGALIGDVLFWHPAESTEAWDL